MCVDYTNTMMLYMRLSEPWISVFIWGPGKNLPHVLKDNYVFGYKHFTD